MFSPSILEAARSGDEHAVRAAVQNVVAAQRAKHLQSRPSRAASSLSVPDDPTTTSLGLDALDRTGRAAIHYAAQGGHSDAVEALLELGADVDARTSDGTTALHLAVDGNHEAVVEVLFLYKCNVNLVDDLGFTAVHRATAAGHALILSMLVDQSADLAVESGKGWAALHVASFYGSVNITSILLQGTCNINRAARQNGWTPLHCGAIAGSTDVVKLLLQHGAAVSYGSPSGVTALQLACTEGHEDVAKELLRFGAEPEVTGEVDDAIRELLESADDLARAKFDPALCAIEHAPSLPLQANHHVTFTVNVPPGVKASHVFCFFERTARSVSSLADRVPLAAQCAEHDLVVGEAVTLAGSTCRFQNEIHASSSSDSSTKKKSGKSHVLKVKFLPSSQGKFMMHLRTRTGNVPLAGFPLLVIVSANRVEALRNEERIRRLGGVAEQESLAQRLELLENELLCTKCETNRRDVVLLPCNHLFLCTACALPAGKSKSSKKSKERKLVRKCVCRTATTGHIKLSFLEEDASEGEDSDGRDG
jgi:ankyrin repeat protein